jgi:signal transduction histidine kinase
VFYGVLENIFYKQIDNGLLTEKAIIETEIQHDQDIPDYSSRFGHEIEVELYRRPIKKSFTLKDTAIVDSASTDEAYYRYLVVHDNKSKRGYSIQILRPLSGRGVLFRSVVDVMLVMFLFLITVSILINYLISRKLWFPFYNTIRKISQYDIKDKTLIEFPGTNVKEFNKLNEVLHKMSEKIRRDFFNLKEFTENASHEIQTPLAIIKSKIEILVQSENLTPAQMELIQSIDMAVSRLSKLNSGLILITKIENNQFQDSEPVMIHVLIEKTIESFDEFIKHKNLALTTDFVEKPVFQMNPVLAEILINNLINNAIKHNCVNGYIKILLDAKTITISNSGLPLSNSVKPLDLFNRFTKGGKHPDSLGLGLAIVKKICDFHRMSIRYHFESDNHVITICMKK